MKRRINGLAVALAVILVGCTNPKEPFLDRGEKPSEICLPNGQFGARIDTDAAFQPDAPMRYVVQRGDTLWGISKRFLILPWYWKEIWYDNPQVRNPHLIYPGDVLTVVNLNGKKHIMIGEANPQYHGSNTGRRTKGGLPIYKYTPQAQDNDIFNQPITIAGSSIHSHALKNRIMKPHEIQALPFVFGNGSEYLTLTQQQEIFARGATFSDAEHFGIYRVGDPIFDLDKERSKSRKDRFGKDKVKPLAYEVRHIGDAMVTGKDYQRDLLKLKPLELIEPLHEQDVLLPINVYEEPNYFPKLPSPQCDRGYIVDKMNKTSLSIREFDTLITSFGRNDGAEVGDIWKIARMAPMRVIQGQTIDIPPREVGSLMIIRVYDDVSIGFVLDSTQNILETDALVRP